MVGANFQIDDKLKKARFFQNIFLVANISIEVILKMVFLFFSNAYMQFVKKKLT